MPSNSNLFENSLVFTFGIVSNSFPLPSKKASLQTSIILKLKLSSLNETTPLSINLN